jgi:hypothetical protein
VLVGDHLYGDTDASGIPSYAELLTGELKWKERGSGCGLVAITVADGHIYLRYSDPPVRPSRVKSDKGQHSSLRLTAKYCSVREIRAPVRPVRRTHGSGAAEGGDRSFSAAGFLRRRSRPMRQEPEPEK